MEGFVYGGFWRRVAAELIDFLILILLNVPIMLAIAFLHSDAISGLAILILWIYYAVMESSSKQATFGKQAMGLKVVDLNGDRISFMRAWGRTLGKGPSSAILGIGFLMNLFTERRQCLHDMMAGCLVIREEGSIENIGPQTSRQRMGYDTDVNVLSAGDAPLRQPDPVPIPKVSGIIEDDKLPESVINAIYAHVAKELDAKKVDRGLWTRAEVQSGGDPLATRIRYTKLRFQMIADAEVAKQRKAKEEAVAEKKIQDEIDRLERELKRANQNLARILGELKQADLPVVNETFDLLDREILMNGGNQALQQLIDNADKGSSVSNMTLGFIYLHGLRNLEPNEQLAFNRFASAMKEADSASHKAIAEKNIGVMLAFGLGCKMNRETAMQMLSRSAKYGNLQAIRLAQRLATNLKSENPFGES